MRTFVSAFVALAITVPAVAGEYNKTVNIGQKAPDFSGIPATYMGQDTSITLSDIEEDVVVLVFLGNHCPYVVAIEDHLNDFVDNYEGKSVKLVGVSVNENPADKLPQIKEWVKTKGSKYVYGYDETQEIGRNYGSTKTPEFFVLDKDRVIRYMGAMYKNPLKVEPGDTNYVAEAVDALLAGEEVKIKETPAIGCGVQYRRK
ncbi:thioredoxin family protein [Tautonia sociabilis]|uniref:Thioredoxin family protein n=1 Tax=Tautonia sociabilis TaxID=2080755 RepID=A0A432MFJ5_9BACT|nr:thioredoxin family protein [Tautonia sociabilis]RUL84998.1 thioredoxin family protein [Tautonia sociabilis]